MNTPDRDYADIGIITIAGTPSPVTLSTIRGQRRTIPVTAWIATIARPCLAGEMPVRIDGPSDDVAALAELSPLWRELHEHHRQVATYGPLVADPEASWAARKRWYTELLADGARYFVARNEHDRALGYGLVTFLLRPTTRFWSAAASRTSSRWWSRRRSAGRVSATS